MLASDAVAVTPIRRIPGEQERRHSSELDGVATGLDRISRRPSPNAGAARFSGGESVHEPVSPSPVPLTATPNAGFVTQIIHQEAMGDGLHIEPWPAAIEAYRRADAAPAAASPRRMPV